MDHLPQALQPEFPYPQVPYLEGFVYDDGGFTGFPARMGFDKKRYLAGNFTEHPPTITAAFLQSWLYFGMMSEVFGTHVELDDFVVKGDQSHNSFITTKNSLLPYIKRWLGSLEKGGLRDTQIQIRQCLQEANIYAACLSGGRYGDTQCPLPSEVSLSIMTLGATLEASLLHKQKKVGFTIERRKWGYWPTITNRLISLGWCINDISRLAELGSIILGYFASTIRRDVPEGRSHQTCTIERCTAHHIEGGKYPTKHVRADCDCGHIKVPVEKVTKILGNGGLPVIRILPPTEGDGPFIDVVQHRLGISFCAFSHVWSDGLGNWQQNSLPACQLRRLRDIANALTVSENWSLSAIARVVQSKAVYIWIDTLCVPVKGPFRRVAISKMAETYAQASNVLVLDSEIQQISLHLSVEELLLRVSCCGWMRRVWTLLEGSLGSQKLCVQFLDGALRLLDARIKLKNDWIARPIVTDSIPTDVGIFHDDLNFMRKAFNSTSYLPGDINAQSHAFGIALHGFIGRATSWKGDELICLAILLGLRPAAVTELQETAVENREFTFLSLWKNIPLGLLFCSGPKFEQPGYRWMRRDFWRARPYAYFRPARLRPDVGLEVTLPGFVLRPMLLPHHFFLFQNIANQQWYKATYDGAVADLPPSSEALEALGHAPVASPMGVICPTLKITRNTPHEIDKIPAALVSIYKRTNTTLNLLDVGRTAIYVRYICYIELTLPEPEEIERERFRLGENSSRYIGEAEKATVHVGESLRNKLGLQMLSEYNQEWLEQTWYVS